MAGKSKSAPRDVRIDSKGYLAIRAGPQRGKRVHTLVAEAMLGRKLAPGEEVHHLDGNKLNNDWRNLQVLGKKDHGAVSARQRWYFKEHDIRLKREWDEFFAEANRSVDGDSSNDSKDLDDRAGSYSSIGEEGDTTFP